MIETMFLHRRHARRYRQIVRVLLAHGLGGVIAPFDPRGKQDADPNIGEAADRIALHRARHLRQALEELGPTFIKLGQILSTRADILPPVYIRELEKLQDDVPPVDGSEILEIVEWELGDSVEAVFASFDPVPIATASIGQVHAATLLDGQQVVLKVQRPNVDQVIHQDLFILGDVARIAENRSATLRNQDLSGLIREFSWTIRAELDFEREARNQERFERAFSDHPNICIPAVFRKFSTPRVLTMERIIGIPIDDARAIRAAGHSTGEIVDTVIQMLAESILDIGLFHADPHPGNFVVADNGVLVVFDFGMVGTLDEHLREQLLLLVLGAAERDAARVTDQIAQLGVVPAGWDRRAMERDVSHLISQYVGVELNTLPIPMIIGDVMTMMRRHQLHLPSELALLAKTATMTESLARSLEPNVNVIELVDPIVRDAMRRFYTLDFWKEKLRLRPLEVALLAAALPGHIQRILTRIDRNELMFQMRYEQLPETIQGLNGMVNRLALAILSAAGMIGLAMLYLAIHPTFGSWHGWVFGIAFLAITGMTLTVLIRIRGSGG